MGAPAYERTFLEVLDDALTTIECGDLELPTELHFPAATFERLLSIAAGLAMGGSALSSDEDSFVFHGIKIVRAHAGAA